MILSAAFVSYRFFWNGGATTEDRSDAAGTSVVATADPQTGEYYDFYVTGDASLRKGTSPGPAFFTVVNLKLTNRRFADLPTIYSFFQRPQPYVVTQKAPIFTRTSPTSAEYTASVFELTSTQCLDLHSSSSRTPSSYLGTFCIAPTVVNPTTNRQVAYSPAGNPLVEFTYSNKTHTSALMITTVFNKLSQGTWPDPFHTVKPTRYTFVSLGEANTRAGFKPVEYVLQAITAGLTEQQINRICSNGAPLKQLAVGATPGLLGKAFYQWSASSTMPGCSFKHTSQLPFAPNFISLEVEGGIFPSPQVSPRPTPFPSPVASPMPTLSPRPSVTPVTVSLVTQTLPDATVGQAYTGSVVVALSRPYMAEQMEITALPAGLRQGACRALPPRAGNTYYFECEVTGTPTMASFEPTTVRVVVWNSNTTLLSSYVQLKVQATQVGGGTVPDTRLRAR